LSNNDLNSSPDQNTQEILDNAEQKVKKRRVDQIEKGGKSKKKRKTKRRRQQKQKRQRQGHVPAMLRGQDM
jgi:hypothetical protein